MVTAPSQETSIDMVVGATPLQQLKIVRTQSEELIQQYEAIQSETQTNYSRDSFTSQEPIEDLVYHVLSTNFEGLDSLNREEVVDSLQTFCQTNLRKGANRARLLEKGLTKLMNSAFRGEERRSPYAMVMAFDRAYQRRTGDESLFDLTQETHLHKWELPFYLPSTYYNCKANIKEAVYHTLTEDRPKLGLTDTTEVIEAVAALPSGLANHFKSLNLWSIMQYGFEKEERRSPLAVLKLFDEARQDYLGVPSLFSSNQPIYLDENSYKVPGGKSKSWTPVRYNRVFYPTYQRTGKPITPEQFNDELRAIVAQGTSPFLGDILFAAATSGERPQFLLDARLAFPNRTWDQLMEACGLNYVEYVPTEQPGRVGKVNGVVNGKTLADKIFGHSDIRLKLPFNPILCKPIRDDVPEEVLEELLAEDYKPEGFRKPLLPRLKINQREEARLTLYRRYKMELDRIQTLTDDEMELVAKEKTYHELKARQAYNSGDWKEFTTHARRYRATANYMTEVNLGFALSLARRYHKTFVPFGEVLQEANEALIKAVETDKYWKRPFFNLWPMLKIRQRVVRYQRAYSRKVSISEGTCEVNAEIERATLDYYKSFGTLPSKEQLMELTDLTEPELDRAEKAMLFENSMDPPEVDSELNLLNLADDEPQYSVSEIVDCKLTAARLERILDYCSTMSPDSEYYIDPKQEYLLRHRMGLGLGFSVKTSGDLKREFGTKTHSSVNSPQVKALARFKKALVREKVTLTELVGAKRRAEMQASM